MAMTTPTRRVTPRRRTTSHFSAGSVLRVRTAATTTTNPSTNMYPILAEITGNIFFDLFFHGRREIPEINIGEIGTVQLFIICFDIP